MTQEQAGGSDPVAEPYRVTLTAGGGMGAGRVELELVRDGQSRWERGGGWDIVPDDPERLFVTTLEPGQFEELIERIEAAGFFSVSANPKWSGAGTDESTYHVLVEGRGGSKHVECYGLTFVDEMEAPAEVKALDATWDAVFDFARGLEWADLTERPSLTEDLARRVAAILETADGGCRWCQVEIAKRAGQEFPEFDWFGLIAEAGEFPVEELHEIDRGDK